jgi:hypothetical protein
MGVIQKVPVINEEFDRLSEEDKSNPHKLFKAINNPNNAKGSYFFKMKAFFDNEKKRHEEKKKQKVEFGFQSRQIRDIDAPFARYPMPNLKNIKMNEIKRERFSSLPPMNENYRPQRKQYAPSEVKQYMTSTIDLSQPDFTYCPIKDVGKHSEYIRMLNKHESDKRFDEKYLKTIKKGISTLEQRKHIPKSLVKSPKDILLRNSMYILPHLKDATVKSIIILA